MLRWHSEQRSFQPDYSMTTQLLMSKAELACTVYSCTCNYIPLNLCVCGNMETILIFAPRCTFVGFWV